MRVDPFYLGARFNLLMRRYTVVYVLWRSGISGGSGGGPDMHKGVVSVSHAHNAHTRTLAARSQHVMARHARQKGCTGIEQATHGTLCVYVCVNVRRWLPKWRVFGNGFCLCVVVRVCEYSRGVGFFVCVCWCDADWRGVRLPI